MIDFDSKEPAAKIKVIGVGGGGGNAINTMVAGRLEGLVREYGTDWCRRLATALMRMPGVEAA